MIVFLLFSCLGLASCFSPSLVKVAKLYEEGKLSYQKGEFDKSLKIFQKGIRDARKLKNDSLLIYYYMGLGYSSLALGDTQSCLMYWRKARDLMMNQPFSKEWAMRMGELGWSLISVFRYTEGDTFVDISKNMFLRLGAEYLPYQAQLVWNKGYILLKMGDLEGAKKYFKESRDLLLRLSEKYKEIASGIEKYLEEVEKGEERR